MVISGSPKSQWLATTQIPFLLKSYLSTGGGQVSSVPSSLLWDQIKGVAPVWDVSAS
jgi:hypothetical protein